MDEYEETAWLYRDNKGRTTLIAGGKQKLRLIAIALDRHRRKRYQCVMTAERGRLESCKADDSGATIDRGIAEVHF